MVSASDSFPAVLGSSLAQTPYVDLLWVVPNSYLQRTVCFQPDGAFDPSPPCEGIQIPQSWKFLLVESGILGLGVRNTAVGIRNPNDSWNPESKFH